MSPASVGLLVIKAVFLCSQLLDLGALGLVLTSCWVSLGLGTNKLEGVL